MNIAIIGGGAAGMTSAYYLGKNHNVTIFEKAPVPGGNIRTLNKNVTVDNPSIPEGVYVDNGVIEFDESNFIEFHGLMKELGVDMERVELTTAYFAENGENSMREVCAAIGRMLGQDGETQSMTVEEAAAEWGEGPANDTMGSNSRVRAVRARKELGWAPHAPSLIEEIERGCYALGA